MHPSRNFLAESSTSCSMGNLDLFLTPPSSSGLHICKAPYYELSCRNHLNRAQERGAAPLLQLSPAEDQNRRNPHQKYCGSGNGGVHLSGGFLAEGSRADRISQQIFGFESRNCALFLPVLSSRKSGTQLQKTYNAVAPVSTIFLPFLRCRTRPRESVVNEASARGKHCQSDFPSRGLMRETRRSDAAAAARSSSHQQVGCKLLAPRRHMHMTAQV